LLNRIDCIVKYFEKFFSFFFFVGVRLHLDLELILKISVFLFFLVDGGFDIFLLINNLFLLQQILTIFFDFQLQLLIGFYQLLSFSFDLSQQSFILIFFLVKSFDLVFQLLDKIEVCGSDLCVVCFDV